MCLTCVVAGVKPLPADEPAVNGHDEQVFVAFARVFSGVVRRGQTLYVLGPKHDPCKLLNFVCLFVLFFYLLIFTYVVFCKGLVTEQLLLLQLTDARVCSVNIHHLFTCVFGII